MGSSILILIGLGCMFFAVIFISKHSKKETEIYSDILIKYKDIKDYSDTMEQIVDNLDKLIDSFLDKHNALQNNMEVSSRTTIDVENSKDEKKADSISITEDVSEENNEIMQKKYENKKKDLNDQVRELKKLGFSNHEIAKKLGKGIREIDIISKMIALRDRNSFS